VVPAMRTHARCTWYPCNLDLWPFDLRVSACRSPAMDYISADFGDDSSSCFHVRARTNRQTDRRDWTPYPTPAAIQPNIHQNDACGYWTCGYYNLTKSLICVHKHHWVIQGNENARPEKAGPWLVCDKVAHYSIYRPRKDGRLSWPWLAGYIPK